MSLPPSADEATDSQSASRAPVWVQTWADMGLLTVSKLENAATARSRASV